MAGKENKVCPPLQAGKKKNKKLQDQWFYIDKLQAVERNRESLPVNPRFAWNQNVGSVHFNVLGKQSSLPGEVDMSDCDSLIFYKGSTKSEYWEKQRNANYRNHYIWIYRESSDFLLSPNIDLPFSYRSVLLTSTGLYVTYRPINSQDDSCVHINSHASKAFSHLYINKAENIIYIILPLFLMVRNSFTSWFLF